MAGRSWWPASKTILARSVGAAGCSSTRSESPTNAHQHINAYAQFIDEHTLKTMVKKRKENVTSSRYIVLATGGRPRLPDIPGARELGVSSDDLFSLRHSLGKTLIVGASCITLDCAGFLVGLGLDVTVMVLAQTTAEETAEGEYNTVLFAIGRDTRTESIGLDKVFVRLNLQDGKVVCTPAEQSGVPNIYAIGDVVSGKPGLTPVAIQAGRLLARRLVNEASILTDHDNVATTVFTPMEYGCVGLSEEEAIERHGVDDM